MSNTFVVIGGVVWNLSQFDCFWLVDGLNEISFRRDAVEVETAIFDSRAEAERAFDDIMEKLNIKA